MQFICLRRSARSSASRYRRSRECWTTFEVSSEELDCSCYLVYDAGYEGNGVLGADSRRSEAAAGDSHLDLDPLKQMGEPCMTGIQFEQCNLLCPGCWPPYPG